MKLSEKYDDLKKTIHEYFDAISNVPMRSVDCDQDEVNRLERKIFNYILNDGE